jgi:2-dehydro-3-deoxyphosphogluconate aldolase / (4S)-4-hydroxy-2-oxoglutarate aldolase
MNVLESIGELKIVPVIALDRSEDAGPLGDALLAGGLPCAEITFRTDAAVGAIEVLAKNPDILLGAGTVLTVDQVKAAFDAGARFIVAPGLNSEVVRYCVEYAIPITPGVCTPSDIERAIGLGLDVVKFFPAEAFGGLKTLKAISAPYSGMRFIPTGGVNAANLRDYLAFPKVLACGGSWIAKRDLINAGRFDEITRLARAAVALVGSG